MIHGLDIIDRAETVLVLPVESYLAGPPPRPVIDALSSAYARGARIASLCVGAFAVAASGLLDGREATTHWRFCDQLADEHRKVRVRPDVLYVDTGQILTSGGVAAGVDLCLHLVRTDLGAEVANRLSRRLVAGPHRDGGQAQYIEHPVPSCPDDPIGLVLTWALSRLDQPLTIQVLADQCHLSVRTFCRQFRRATGTTPHQWILIQRLELAKRLLEVTDLTVDQIARRAGFTGALGLRQSFGRRLGVAPAAYRRTFSHHRSPPPAERARYASRQTRPTGPKISGLDRHPLAGYADRACLVPDDSGSRSSLPR